MVVAAFSGVVAFVVAAADKTRRAEARLAKPSQSREGLTNGFAYVGGVSSKKLGVALYRPTWF